MFGRTKEEGREKKWNKREDKKGKRKECCVWFVRKKKIKKSSWGHMCNSFLFLISFQFERKEKWWIPWKTFSSLNFSPTKQRNSFPFSGLNK
jgi:hypothetical protein